MTYLIRTTESYRLDSEEAAKAFIAEQRENHNYEVIKYSSELRQTKQKGEIVDEWYRVTLVKVFNSEKEPDTEVTIDYSKE